MTNEDCKSKTCVLHHKDTTTLWKVVNENYLLQIEDTSCWHKFTILGGNQYDKEDILKIIIAYSHPGLLIPVKYQSDGEHSFFLATMCFAAIVELCRHSLTVYHEQLKKKVYIEITLNYMAENEETFRVQKEIAFINTQRYDSFSSTLDLSSYHKNQGMVDFFVSLSFPKSLHYVLTCSWQCLLKTINLLMPANEIRSLESLECLSMARNIKQLDLRNNELDFDGFSKLPTPLKIKKLWLSGNPMCSEFKTPREYIRAVKSLIPSVELLDGEDVSDSALIFPSDNPLLPVQPPLDSLRPIRAFAPRTELRGWAEQFLWHYFGLSESPVDRVLLTRMYHNKAVFSVTVSASSKRGSSVKQWDRNILKISDYSKMYDLMKQGPSDIMSLINSFPALEFDKLSITLDMPFFEDDKTALVMVTGLMKEKPTDRLQVFPEDPYAFSRCFVLHHQRKSSPGEWCIINDMWCLLDPSPFQLALLDPTHKLMRKVKDEPLMLPVNWGNYKEAWRTKEEEQKLVDNFRDLTTLDTIWCKKLLEDASWDLEIALQAFTDQYKTHQIPAEAFV